MLCTPTSSVSFPSTTRGTSDADPDILRQELQRVHTELHVATTVTDAYCGQQCWDTLLAQQNDFVNAARHHHDRSEVAVDEVTTQTPTDTLHELFRFFKKSKLVNTSSDVNQQMKILNQTNSVTDNTTHAERSMLVSVASAAHHRNGTFRSVKKTKLKRTNVSTCWVVDVVVEPKTRRSGAPQISSGARKDSSRQLQSW